MQKRVTIILLLLLQLSCSSQKKRTLITINSKAYQALKKYNPDFNLWAVKDYMPSIQTAFSSSHPGIVSINFNEDNIGDYVVMGHDRKHEFLLALVSNKTGFKVHKLDKATYLPPQSISMVTSKNKREFGLWTYLSVFKSTKLKSNYEQKSILIKNKALKVNYFEKGSLVYYFKNNKFHKFISTKKT